MLVLLIAIYVLSVLGFLRTGLADDIRTGREALQVIVESIFWPLVHLPWRDWIEPGSHRGYYIYTKSGDYADFDAHPELVHC